MEDDFEDQMERGFADSWRPEEGDKIQGIITAVGSRTSEYGPYPILTIRRITNDVLTAEEVAIHCMDNGRKQWIEENEPQRGDRIGFQYKGTVPSKVAGRKPYHNFGKSIQRGDEIPAHLRLSASTRPAPRPAPPEPARRPDPVYGDEEPF